MSRSLASSLRSMVAPLLLGLVCFVVYNANLRQIGAGDSLAARFLPLVLLHDGTLALDHHVPMVARGHTMPWEWNVRDPGASYFESPAYWMVRTRTKHMASMYPVVTPVLVTPLYIPAVMWLNRHGWDAANVDWVAELMEKVSASVLASVASVLMFVVLRREAGRWALPLALVFAFGTNTWMISSQALWQHGAGQLLIALALLLVLSPGTPVRMTLLGAVCALMAANRPPDGLIAGAFVLFSVWRRWRDLGWIVAGAVPFVAALLAYNLHFIGHPLGGYALAKADDANFFSWNLAGLAGLLVSPARGLLVFTPFLAFVPFGFLRRLRTPGTRALAALLGCAVAAQLVVYSLADWRAGVAWGPRWLTDVLPILMWMLVPVTAALRPLARGLLLATMAFSVGVQVIGAFWYTEESDERIFANDPSSMRAAWQLRNVPFVVELGHPPARAELLDDVRGWLDLVGTKRVRRLDEVLKLEDGAVLEGWALAGDRTPAQVLILIDGVVAGSTGEFFAREDVSKSMRTTAPSGWRLTINTRGIREGARVVQIAVRNSPRSDIRIIRSQRASVTAPTSALAPFSATDVDAMSRRAAARLRERQTAEGYWFTAHTKDIRYEAPQPEMNTFLTSMLLDELAPIARRHGLDEAMTRARTHLTAQIETNGLVRYHGLPNGPGIGTLGCVISPDADDSALVWRIAGPGSDDPRKSLMLRELAHYRDEKGLYRTWLAPRDQYQGIDPGLNPNPADLTIQMHVYLMLREFDPPAAEQLCGAIQRSFGDAAVWVYYANAPLLSYLRAAELRRLGCTVELPTDRLAHPAAGQEIWSETARLLVDITQSPDDGSLRKAIRDVLSRLGRDDFAQLRATPPLLYHNDLSASVRRFYWSEDFGYALWLRLYAAADNETENPR